LRKNKGIWLFECGEDTQRQLMSQPLVRPGKVERIFLSRASAECVLGLPGAGLLSLGNLPLCWCSPA